MQRTLPSSLCVGCHIGSRDILFSRILFRQFVPSVAVSPDESQNSMLAKPVEHLARRIRIIRQPLFDSPVIVYSIAVHFCYPTVCDEALQRRREIAARFSLLSDSGFKNRSL